MARSWSVALGVVVLVSSNPDARADSVPPPTMTCPRGGTGQTSHVGLWCDAKSCTTDADCKFVWAPTGPMQGTCESTSLCVRTERVRQHDTGPAPDGAIYTFEKHIAVRTCTSGSRCDDGSACATEMRCVVPSAKPAAPAPPEGSSRGCGCGKTTGPKAGALVGWVVALWLVRRRR